MGGKRKRKTKGDYDWTADEVKILTAKWAAGHSAFLISLDLPGRSRGAVIGKANRLGLPARKTVQRKPSGIGIP